MSDRLSVLDTVANNSDI